MDITVSQVNIGKWLERASSNGCRPGGDVPRQGVVVVLPGETIAVRPTVPSLIERAGIDFGIEKIGASELRLTVKGCSTLSLRPITAPPPGKRVQDVIYFCPPDTPDWMEWAGRQRCRQEAA